MELARLILDYIRVLIWPLLLVIGAAVVYRRFRGQFNDLVNRVLRGKEYELRFGRAALRVQVIEQAFQEALSGHISPQVLDDPDKLRKIVAEAAARIVQLLGVSRDEMRILKELHLIDRDLPGLKEIAMLRGLDVDKILQVLESKRLVLVDRRGPGDDKVRLSESGVKLVAKQRLYEGLMEGSWEERIVSEYDADLDAYYSDLASSL